MKHAMYSILFPLIFFLLSVPTYSESSDKNVVSRTAEIDGQRLHVSSRVRQVRVTDPWRHQPATFHSNLQPAQNFGGVANGIVSTVQTIEPARMILFVKAFRAHEQVQVSEGTKNFDGIAVRCADRNLGDHHIGKLAQRRARRGIRARWRRRRPALYFLDR